MNHATLPLRYLPGTTFLHRLPALFKLILLMLTGIALSLQPLYTILPISVLTLFSFLIIRFSLHKMIKGHLFAISMGTLIAWGEWKNGESDTILLIISGGRFLAIYYAGILFAAITNPFSLGETIYRLTHPIPFIPSETIRLMISLTLTFIPVLFDESLTIERACRSRLLFRRKNPLRQIRYRTEPLLTGVIRKSEDIGMALLSRGYGNFK